MTNKMKKGILIAIIVIIIFVVGRFVWSEFYGENRHSYLNKVNEVYSSKEEVLNDTGGVFEDYLEYQDFSQRYQLEGAENIVESDFDKNHYFYYVLMEDKCSEEVTLQDIYLKDDIMYLTFNADINCGACGVGYHIYLVPIAKNVDVKDYKVDYAQYNLADCDDLIAYKPILYLYPEKGTNVSVKLQNEDKLLTTYPQYKNGWNVFAKANGDLYDENGKYYYALYWDELNPNSVDFQTGFYVTKEKAISFLEEKLSIIGLNDRERNEFIMYWLPKLEENGKSLVYFELTEERELYNKLMISPKPDSLLRINMHIKKVEQEVFIKEQILSHFDRVGFVAVEWGGTIYES